MPTSEYLRVHGNAESSFYASVQVFDDFDRVADAALYAPLPAGWMLGNADVVGSTQAKAAGRAKAVNIAGASVIAAVTNALGGEAIPYVFGGDGASLAVPPELAAKASDALSAVALWATQDLELPMRVGMVPVEAIREAGLDVRVSRYAPSPHVRYAMFAGGGMRWAERQIKLGNYALPPAPPDARPDLSGLSCNWEAIHSAMGVILTIMLNPERSMDDPRFITLVSDLNALLADKRHVRSPLPAQGPPFRFPPTGLGLLAIVQRRPGEWTWVRRIRLAAEALFAYVVLKTGIKVGNFEPDRYRHEIVTNADFRGYDDGLRMTVDCSAAQADRIEALLGKARERGIARHGLHREAEALMTCIAPLPSRSDHVHFIDGASGGYTLAALQLKAGG